MTLPASRANIEIFGASGSGKSYMAGLIAEQLVDLRYTVCILDLEGDHVGLAQLHGVVAVGGPDPLPDPQRIAGLLTHGIISVVVDLSLQPESVKFEYSRRLLDELYRTRLSSGIPHWILVEEAHLPLRANTGGWWCSDTEQSGLCVVSYRPELICRHVSARSDFVITLGDGEQGELSRLGLPGARPFVLPGRTIPHSRHWHKYTLGALPRDRHFFFRGPEGLIGRTAANIPEFLDIIASASDDVLVHHAGNGDVSRWLDHLCKDEKLVEAVRRVERAIVSAADSTNASVKLPQLRTELIATVQREVRPPRTRGAPSAAGR